MLKSAPAPLDASQARALIGGTRLERLLLGYRGKAPANMQALCELLVVIGNIAIEVPKLMELDLNPVMVDANGILLVDARARFNNAQAPQVLSLNHI